MGCTRWRRRLPNTTHDRTTRRDQSTPSRRYIVVYFVSASQHRHDNWVRMVGRNATTMKTQPHVKRTRSGCGWTLFKEGVGDTDHILYCERALKSNVYDDCIRERRRRCRRRRCDRPPQVQVIQLLCVGLLLALSHNIVSGLRVSRP